MSCYASEIRDHDDIRKIVRQRKTDLQLSDALLERFAGLAAGHVSKILPSNPRKRIGWDVLPFLLEGVGLRLFVMEDSEATKRILSRADYEPRREQYVQPRKQIAGSNV
jgi:hypothetical protein